MQLRCPECRSSIDVPEFVGGDGYVCAQCGTKINLEVDPLKSTTAGDLAETGVHGRAPELHGAFHREFGKFRIVREVGRGGFGTVYKAVNTELESIVALKIPRSAALVSEAERREFLREARKAASLDHPNIVPVYDAGEISGIPFIVGKFVEGKTLADYKEVRQLTWRQCAELVAALADALHSAHEQGLVHRDVKPQNIMVDRDERPLLMDFGLAKDFQREITMTSAGHIKGTPAYMSPEQAEGDSSRIDRRTDIYSLGVVLYELLTDELPFRGTPQKVIDQIRANEPRQLRSLNGRIPPDLETICQKAMEKEPKRRYRTAAALGEDLRAWLEHRPITARPIGRIGRMLRWCRRNRVVAASIATIATILLGATVVSYGMYRQTARALARERQERTLKQEALDRETNERIAKQDALDKSRERLSSILVEKAQLSSTDDLMTSTLWVAQALEVDQGHPDRELMGRLRMQAVLDRCPHLERLLPHEFELNHAALSTDGRYVLTACQDSLRAWDLSSGNSKPMRVWQGTEVSHVEFGPGDQFVAMACGDGMLRVSEFPAGERQWTLGHEEPSGPARALKQIRFRPFQEGAPDRLNVLTIGADRKIRIWSVFDGQQVQLFESTETIPAAAFDSSGKYLAMSGADNKLELVELNPDATEVLSTKTLSHSAAVKSFAFSPDGATIAAACADGAVRLWPVREHDRPTKTQLYDHQEVSALTFSRDGRWLATAGGGGDVTISWAKADPSAAALALTPHVKLNQRVTALAFDDDGEYLAAVCDDNRVRVWQLAEAQGALSLQPVTSPIIHPREIKSVGFVSTEDSVVVLTASRDGFTRLWRLPEEHRSRTLPASSQVQNVAWSSDGKRFVAASKDRDHAAMVCELEADGDIAEVWTLDFYGESRIAGDILHTGNVHHADLSQDGSLVVTGCMDKKAIVWDVRTQRAVAGPFEHGDIVNAVAFDATTRFVVTAREMQPEGSAVVWEVDTGRRVLEQGGMIRQATFHPIEPVLAVAAEKTVHLWDATTGQPLPNSLVHEEWLGSFAFSPDGSRLVACCNDGSAQIWDWRNNRRTGQPLQHGSGSLWASFNDAGARIVTVSNNSTTQAWMARVWDASNGKAVSPFVPHTSRVDAAALSPDGRVACTATSEGNVYVWDAKTGDPVAPTRHFQDPLIDVRFLPATYELAAISRRGAVRRFPLPLADASPQRLRAHAELLTGQRFNDAGGFTALTHDQMRERYRVRLRDHSKVAVTRASLSD